MKGIKWDLLFLTSLKEFESLRLCSVEEVKLPQTITSKMIRRISAIMEKVESSVTMDHIMEKYKNLNTLGYSIRAL